MFITRKHLSRRTVLRGLGATVALPFLDAMVPAATAQRKTAAVRKTRLAAIEMVHGAAGSSVEGLAKNYWSPVKEGADFDFSLSLSPLEPYRDYITVISDTDLANAESAAAPEVGGDHNRSSAVFLTASHPKRTEGSDIFAGVSMDQIYAQKFGQDTALPSMQLCIENVGSISGACGYGYSCVYSTAISWASPTMPFPSERDPRVAFERLFGHGATESERTTRRRQDLSIVDAIRQRVAGIQKELGPGDRLRLTEYLDGIGEIERRLRNVEKRNTSGEARSLPDAPIGVPDSFDEHATLMYDLMTVAFQADVTRVFTFMLSRELSQRTYPYIGVTEQHHTVSHHGNKPEAIAQNVKINTYHAGLFAKFIEKLKALPDGDGSVLDHSLIVYGGGMGNPNGHASDPLPVVAVGGGVGKGHRHLKLKPQTPVGNLWLAVADRFGERMETFGDGNSRVEGFFA